MSNTVVIDCFPSSAIRYRGWAIVAIDVIRATTVAVTGAETGWRCFIAGSLEEAMGLKSRLPNSLLLGELGGNMPDGFDMNNSPAELAERTDNQRPLIMLSTSGTQLIHEACKWGTAYVACLRNYMATARYLIGRHENIAVIGAGSRNEFREEDQLCCSWLADELVEAGYRANTATSEMISLWRGKPVDDAFHGNSVAYLRRSNQLKDRDFILAHVNDLNSVFTVADGEVTSPVLSGLVSVGADR